MLLSRHNVEQMARGYLMYQLAKRGYNVQITDSRFPTVDLLVVSPSGEYFGIDVKGQKTKNFWRFNEREPKPDFYFAFIYVPVDGTPRVLLSIMKTRGVPKPDFYFAFIYVPVDGTPRVFIMDSKTAISLWREYKSKALERGLSEESIWGLNWTQPFPYEDKYDLLPR